MPEDIDNGQPLPYSDWCFICGDNNQRGVRGRFYRDGLRVWIDVAPDNDFNGYPGVLHGGVTAGLLDETMGWVAALAIDRMCRTAELNVRYVHPVPVGKLLRVEAEPVKINKRMCTVKGEIRVAGANAESKALATATGKFMPLSESETRFIDDRLIYEPGRSSIFCCGKDSRPPDVAGT
jgi:uncharacterized protein (TIGR00369 family)